MAKWKRLKLRSLKGITPESWHCVDCGVDTAPGNLGRVQMEEDFRKNGSSNFTVSKDGEGEKLPAQALISVSLKGDYLRGIGNRPFVTVIAN
jgi:hypothetical protein